MANFDTFEDLRVDALRRAGESPTDTAGDYYARTELYLVRAAHEIENKHPFLWTRVYPPGVLRTVAPAAIASCTVTGGSTSVTSLSPAPGGGVSYLHRKIVFAGVPGFWRVAAHAAGATTLTLDTAFDGSDSAAQAATIYQDEYPLATGVRHLVQMIVAETGAEVIQKPEEWLRAEYPEPRSAGWPPRYFARITDTHIVFSEYPTVARRIEYPYTDVSTDLAAGGAIRVPRLWRPVIADGALFFLLYDRNDSKRAEASALFLAGLDAMINDDLRQRSALTGPRFPDPGPYA